MYETVFNFKNFYFVKLMLVFFVMIDLKIQREQNLCGFPANIFFYRVRETM